MTWLTVWIAKKLDIQARMDKQKIIEYNAIIRNLKIKLTGVERELTARKAGFLPMLCNTCIHTYEPKPPSEPIGTYEPPERNTDPVQGARQRSTRHQVYPKSGDYVQHVNEVERKRFETRKLNPMQTQHTMPTMPRNLSLHKITLH